MKSIFFSEALSSLKLIDTIFDAGLPIQDTDDSRRAIVVSSALSTEEQEMFADFITLLKVDKTVDNVGIVTYDKNHVFKFFSYPTVATLNGQIGIMIGVTDESRGFTSAFVPLVWVPNKNYEETGEDAGGYFFQVSEKKRVKAQLVTIPSQMNPDEDRHYICIKSKKFIYNLTFKVEPDVTSEQILQAWYEGKFELVCRSFFRAACSGNKMFGDCFRRGDFPSEGVLLILENGTIKENEFTDTKGKTKKLISSKWRLKASSHPNLPVRDFSANPVALDEVGTIFCNKSMACTQFLLNKPHLNEKYYLHIIGINASNPKNPNPDWVPSHTGSYKLDNLPLSIFQTFKMFIEDAFSSHTETANILPPSAAETEAMDNFDKTTIDVAYEDVNGKVPEKVPF